MRSIAKWAGLHVGLLLQAYCMFVFINTALLLPEPYRLERITFVLVAAVLGAAVAYGNGLLLLKILGRHQHIRTRALVAFPFIAWELVVFTVLWAIAVQIRHVTTR